jgi:DNA-binding transcriptional LysR family regulator
MSSNSISVLIQMALVGRGIIRVPLHAVRAEIADKTLDVILKDVSLSPERMSAYYAKVKPMPAKTADFINFLASSISC